MNLFTIKDIENLSGIKAHTWRIWEQRYGIGVAQRKDSRHRFFDNDNLKKVLRISYLYHTGVKISKIINLGTEELKELTLANVPDKNAYDFYVKELIEAAVDLDEDRFEHLLTKAMQKMGTEDAMLKVMHPFQKKVGMLWLTDHLIPAQEHFTSNLISKKIIVATHHLPSTRYTSKKKIVLFTPENEQHELPLLFINYLLKKNGNRVIYFGRNVPLDHIENGILQDSFSHLWFHLITNFTGQYSSDFVKKISSRFHWKQIIMSGPEVSNVTKTPINVKLLTSMDEIIKYSKL